MEKTDFFKTLPKNHTYAALLFSHNNENVMVVLLGRGKYAEPLIVSLKAQLDPMEMDAFKVNFYDGTEELDLNTLYGKNQMFDINNTMIACSDKMTFFFNQTEELSSVAELFLNEPDVFYQMILKNCHFHLNRYAQYETLTENEEICVRMCKKLILDIETENEAFRQN